MTLYYVWGSKCGVIALINMANLSDTFSMSSDEFHATESKTQLQI